MGEKLPNIGAEAVLLGVHRFKQDSEAVDKWLEKLGKSSINLSKASSSAWSTVASVAEKAAKAVIASTAAITAAILATGAASVKSGADIEDSLLASAAAMEKTRNNIEPLSKEVIELGRAYPESIGAIADSTRELARAGVDMQDIIGGAAKALTDFVIAAAGEVGMEQATLTIASAMRTFGLNGQQVVRVTNAIIAAGIKSAITYKDLDRSFRQVSAVAANLGYSVEETASAIGILGNMGLRGSDAGTSLKQMFISLLKPSAQAAKIMREYGVSLYDSNLEALNLRQVIVQLEQAFGEQAITSGRLSRAERDTALAIMFGSDAVRAAVALSASGADAFDEMYDSVTSMSAAEIAQTMIQGSLNKQLEISRNNLQAFATVLGQPVARELAKSTGLLNNLLRSMDIDVVDLFGQAIARALSGETGFTDLIQQAEAFGPAVQKTFIEFVGVLNIARTAGLRTVDAILGLYDAIGGGSGILRGFNSIVLMGAQSLDLLSGSGVRFIKMVGGLAIAGPSVDEVGIALAKAASIGIDAVTLLGRAITLLIKAQDAFVAATVGMSTYIAITNIPTIIRLGKAIIDLAGTYITLARVVAISITTLQASAGVLGIVAMALTFTAAKAQEANINYKKAVTDISREAALSSKTYEEYIAKMNAANAEVTKLTAKHALHASSVKSEVEAIRLSEEAFWALKTGIVATDDSLADAETFLARAKVALAELEKGLASDEETLLAMREALDMSVVEPGWFEFTDSASDLDAMLKSIMSTLRMLPITGKALKDLASYLADLEQDTPGRLAPMLNILIASGGQLRVMASSYKGILQTTLEIEKINRNIERIQAQINTINLQQRQAVLGMEMQILGIRTQIQALDIQELPVRTRLSEVEHQIALLTQENLELTGKRLNLELQMLPLKSRASEIDAQMQILQRENLDIAKERAQLELEALPLRNELADIEKRITAAHDRRLEIMQREQSLMAERDVLVLGQQLRQVERELDKAWQTRDVGQILALEQEARAIEDQLDPAQERLEILREEQRLTEINTELATIGYELQKVAIEELLVPLEEQLDLLERQERQEKLNNEIIITGLELEKRKIEDLLDPLEKELRLIEYQEKEYELKGRIAAIALEEEARRLNEVIRLIGLERDALQATMQIIELQMAQTSLQFEQQKLQYEELLIQEQLRKASLEETLRKQQEVFADLMSGFLNAMVASGAFTVEEAIEVAKRTGMWDSEALKILEIEWQILALETANDRVTTSVKAIADAYNSIPEKIETEIVTTHKSIYEVITQKPEEQQEKIKGYQYGGIVPGPYGKPRLVIAHGGELFLGMHNSTPSLLANLIRSLRQPPSITYNNSYDVYASYDKVQSPSSVKQDLVSVVAMTRR